mmetsp:Transcript_36375/g.88103  ORF Transcript_36375/g.88103 Transcript_36375/m.88103 type:complete len:298 (+) Transcript_36375:60-953(+)
MIDYSGLSMKTLKLELELCGVRTTDFIEKSEFVKALEDVKRLERKTLASLKSKYAKNEMVLYKGIGGETESATILEVRDSFFYIRLESSGSEQETDESHLAALVPERRTLKSSKSGTTKKKLKRALHQLKNLRDGLSKPTRTSASSQQSDEQPESPSKSGRSSKPRNTCDLSVSGHSTCSRSSMGSQGSAPRVRPVYRTKISLIKKPRNSCDLSVSGHSTCSRSSVGSQTSGPRQQVYKTGSPPERARSFSSSRSMPEKRHTLRPRTSAPSQGKLLRKSSKAQPLPAKRRASRPVAQ